ncbi:MAG: HAMP domain-containing protein, partial [Proteobacteria bacterium]|nr:HAMP domain-containing protein [Pseudomonadota bacterium]
MNIDFRNRTIFTKIFSGFIILLLLATLMGGVLYYSLRDVTGVLQQIMERNAPSIRYSTGVERYALHTILNAKDYLLIGKKGIHEQAMHNIREIYANLDRMDEVTTKYNDQILFRKSKDVRLAVEEYQGYYNRGVALLEENKILEHKMRVLGKKVNDLSHTHTLDHKRLLEKAIANGIDQTKYMKGFYLFNQVENEALEARRQEKNYILYKDREHFDKLKEHIANLRRLYDEISKIAYVFEHVPLMKEIRQATDQYLEAAEKWVANDNELSDILAQMHGIRVNVQQTVQAVQEAGWQDMDTSKQRAAQTMERASLIGILAAFFTLIIGMVLAFFIARGIAGPIKGLTLATAGIAKGDMRKRVVVKGRDEVEQLAIAFNTMVENLQNTMVSRDYFDNIIKSMIDTLIVVDPEAKIITVNPATCHLLG